VGEAARLNAAPSGRRLMKRLTCLTAALALLAQVAAAQTYVVSGSCRDGAPNGAYELRMADGRLRVVGAFAKGRRTGTFLFWDASGARIAEIPYENDLKTGTVALWYDPAKARADPPRKLEAAYVVGTLHGIKRSWHPNGNPRTEFRYERGVLVEARAWVESGAPLSESEARAIAARDLGTDDGSYATLEALVAEYPPRCE
jgi:antitoxin component YwqK of YwqJK toxin-antitoxin module